MEQYRIHDLERLTGIKAHTIRIWEKRYLLINPSRTATNRRFYTASQLIKLMNVTTLLARGYKISSVAALSDQELAKLVENLDDVTSDEVKCEAFINLLTGAMISFNEVAFEQACIDIVHTFGFFDGVIKVIYPFLKKIGFLWRVQRAIPAQEHFAFCIIRRKLIAYTDLLPRVTDSKRRALLFLPPEEWHEVSLLVTNYMMRSRGIATIYLGQSVPFENVGIVIDSVAPQMLMTFYISPKPVKEIETEIVALAKRNPEIDCLLSGDPALLKGIKFNQKNVKYLKDMDSLLQIL